ncbi:hypothetical protein GCM10022403_035020 [Streptomyces coacervatus]|uniref:Uncharacterized protein n=1 Tax=Streptomyces coacervatus TaxID=647381 RepID=A0ABP7HKX2_9ACTN|nr:hypothetical protein [Streptomyces coacervatus]MDF2272027.1 hypothetical protein [Streptomyces coacervatus]
MTSDDSRPVTGDIARAREKAAAAMTGAVTAWLSALNNDQLRRRGQRASTSLTSRGALQKA